MIWNTSFCYSLCSRVTIHPTPIGFEINNSHFCPICIKGCKVPSEKVDAILLFPSIRYR